MFQSSLPHWWAVDSDSPLMVQGSTSRTRKAPESRCCFLLSGKVCLLTLHTDRQNLIGEAKVILWPLHTCRAKLPGTAPGSAPWAPMWPNYYPPGVCPTSGAEVGKAASPQFWVPATWWTCHPAQRPRLSPGQGRSRETLSASGVTTVTVWT